MTKTKILDALRYMFKNSFLITYYVTFISADADSAELERRMSMYDKDDWKKEISVGPEFQAEIPTLLDKVYKLNH